MTVLYCYYATAASHLRLHINYVFRVMTIVIILSGEYMGKYIIITTETETKTPIIW